MAVSSDVYGAGGVTQRFLRVPLPAAEPTYPRGAAAADADTHKFYANDATYGSPRVWDDLTEWGECCSRKRVARLMRSSVLRARARRLRPPTDNGLRPEHCIAPNVLDRQFVAAGPNQKWVVDFIYIRNGEDWLYLAVVLDLSRRAVCWSMSAQMAAQFALMR